MTDVQGQGRLSRGQFLAGAVSAGSAAAAAGALALPAAAQKQSPGACVTGRRAYGSGKYEIELDGAASEIFWTDGGAPSSPVVEDGDTGPDNVRKKHLAGVKYEDFAVHCGMGMAKPMYEWIKASLDKGGSNLRKSGAIHAADFDRRGTQKTFTDAFLTEVGFPALDASSKDDAYLRLGFTVDSSPPTVDVPPNPRRQKAWLCSNFRLRIDGVDTARVASVDSFTWKQPAAVDQSSGRPIRVPGRIEIPNLAIYVPEDGSQGVQAWYQDFVVNGDNSDKNERTGRLEFLAPDNRTVYAGVSFSGLGVFKVAPDKMEAGAEGVRRVKCEMYCESISFSYNDAAWS